MPIVDVINVMKTFQSFYLSGLNTATIPVKLNEPINDTIFLDVERTNEPFTTQMYYFLCRIKIYLSNTGNVQYRNKTMNFNGIKSKFHLLNYINNQSAASFTAQYNNVKLIVDVLIPMNQSYK
jgi:hypothetical protein